MDQPKLSLRNAPTDPRRAFRAKRGDVRLALLDLLSPGYAISGYRLMQMIRERSGGVWRVSAGSVYPTLEKMSTDRVISERYVDGSTVYTITQSGTAEHMRKKNELTRIWNFNEQKDLEHLEPLEQELSKLSEVIELASRSDDETVVDRVFNEVVSLRKRIFGYLAE